MCNKQSSTRTGGCTSVRRKNEKKNYNQVTKPGIGGVWTVSTTPYGTNERKGLLAVEFAVADGLAQMGLFDSDAACQVGNRACHF